MQHRHVLEMVAFYLGIEVNEAIDGVLDDVNVMPYFLDLFVENGRGLCILYYQEGDAPALGLLLTQENYLKTYFFLFFS